MKRNLLGILLLSCSNFLYSQSSQPVPPALEQPNVVFIFADDLGWGDLSCYGNNRVKTPELDQLAKEGTLFTHFYVAGSVCSPSRAGIMTGQYPARQRLFGHLANSQKNANRGMPNALNPDALTLTDLLKKAGYTTGHFGKWHLGDVSPEEYGIDVFKTNHHSNVGNGSLLNITSPWARPTCTRDILNETLHFIDKVDGQPFFANAWLSDTHATLNPSEKQLKEVSRLKPGSTKFHGVEEIYFATLLEMDKQIGRFLDALNKRGLAENTLVIFSSDNGPEDYQIRNAAHSGVGLAGPFRGRKRSIYEGGIRVPLILRWPGKVPSSKVNDFSIIGGVDFIPTLCALAGATLPESADLDGEDMSKVWLGSEDQRQQPLYWEWRYKIVGHILNHSPRLAIREGNYKLLMNPDGSRMELYNIPQDPSELTNLATSKTALAQRLSLKLLNWNDSLPKSRADREAGRNDWKWPK